MGTTTAPAMGDAQLHRLADALPQIVWLTDAEGRTEFLNRQWGLYTGTSGVPATLAEATAEFIHPEDRAATTAAWEAARREERTLQVEHRIRSASGAYRWFLVRAEPERDAAGRVARWFGTSTDIHAQKEAERALAESEARYRTLFDSIDEGFCVIQMLSDDGGRPTDYRFVEINRAWEKHTGLQGALGRTARDLLPGLEEHWFRIYGEVARTGQAVRFESGSDVMGRWFDVFAFRVEAPEERKVALLFTDITENRRGEQERERLLEAALRSEERYRLVNRATNDVIWDWDLATGELTWNEALERTFGHPPERVPRGIGFWYDHIHPEDRERVVGGVHDALEGGLTSWSAEYRFVCGDGSHAAVLDRGVIARDVDGKATRMIGSMLDITARHREEAERERLLQAEHEARAEAEAANRAKMDFLSAMSHELRTPLNAIGGYVDLLEMGIHGPLTPAQRDALVRVGTNQRHLLNLINDVLAFAKLEAGHLELEMRPLSAAELLASVAPLVEPLAEARGIALSVRESDPAVRLAGDEERVRQILLNLVTNAVKFTPPGGWVVRSCERDGGWVCLRVQDNGAGIAPEEHERIFDPFQQVGRRLNRPQEGVGLGLAISRDLARAMGGDLTVRSAPGEGSTFTLRLPRAADAPG